AARRASEEDARRTPPDRTGPRHAGRGPHAHRRLKKSCRPMSILAGVARQVLERQDPMTPKNTETQALTTTLTVDRSPEAVFAAINDGRGWWSGEIEGPTDVLGGEFSYRYRDMHYSKQRVVELTPGKRVVWQIVDSRLTFVDDQDEWNGTRVVFDL